MADFQKLLPAVLPAAVSGRLGLLYPGADRKPGGLAAVYGQADAGAVHPLRGMQRHLCPAGRRLSAPRSVHGQSGFPGYDGGLAGAAEALSGKRHRGYPTEVCPGHSADGHHADGDLHLVSDHAARHLAAACYGMPRSARAGAREETGCAGRALPADGGGGAVCQAARDGVDVPAVLLLQLSYLPALPCSPSWPRITT